MEKLKYSSRTSSKKGQFPNFVVEIILTNLEHVPEKRSN
jgi:hypothetical protein